MLMNSYKIRIPSFRRTPESSNFGSFWMPDQVRHDGDEAFYGFINVAGQ
jgi:hypothetical protein